MRITECGEILRAEDFWDCDCDFNYIHRKTGFPRQACRYCGQTEGDSPDSHLSELIIKFPELLTMEERREAIEEYMERAGLVG